MSGLSNTSIMYKTMRGHCNVGDKSSVGDSATRKVAITVGVGKNNGEKRMTLELEIFNLDVIKYHIS